MLLQDLEKKKLIHPPQWLSANTAYLTIAGSHSYGVADVSDKTKKSDFDVYGFCFPPKMQVFPHLAGEIPGFGMQIKRFQQYQEHHIWDQDALGGIGREYDFAIFGIIRYFQLVMENNPNCLDSLFTRQECVLHLTEVGNLVRENRKMFLHKGCFPRYKGYAYAQLHKMQTKETEGNRRELREKFGFDVKFGMHVVRLLSQCEQILMEGDLDLQRNKEHLKAIRRGEVKEEEIRRWASEKEKHLEGLYAESKLPYGPDEDKIKQLLLKCLEHHYGNLEKAVTVVGKEATVLREIREVMDKYGV